jgi:hypothetical protein
MSRIGHVLAKPFDLDGLDRLLRDVRHRHRRTDSAGI